MMTSITNTKEIINSIWNETLGLQIESDTENFFALGGSSMQAFEITSRLNEHFHLDLTIMDFFEHLNIHEQTTLIHQRAQS